MEEITPEYLAFKKAMEEYAKILQKSTDILLSINTWKKNKIYNKSEYCKKDDARYVALYKNSNVSPKDNEVVWKLLR